MSERDDEADVWSDARTMLCRLLMLAGVVVLGVTLAASGVGVWP